MNDIQIPWLIAQTLGVVAVILGLINYQMKSSRGILLVLMATAVVFSVHYLLLGQMTGFALNFVNCFRTIVYCNRDKKIFSGKYIPFVFAVILGIRGGISWTGPESLLVIGGIVINTLATSSCNAQLVRKSILVSSPMVLVYDIFAKSYGGIVYEAICVISSIIGIIRYRKNENQN